jgi:acetyl esterase/lipase
MATLSAEHNLILDVPGGGFISMGPEHHEERLRSWAVRTCKPVVSIEYGKAPECKLLSHSGLSLMLLNIRSSDPYPFAVEEVFDAYRIIVESKGKAIGVAGEDLNIVLSGDSAYVQMLSAGEPCLTHLVEVAWPLDAL